MPPALLSEATLNVPSETASAAAERVGRVGENKRPAPSLDKVVAAADRTAQGQRSRIDADLGVRRKRHRAAKRIRVAHVAKRSRERQRLRRRDSALKAKVAAELMSVPLVAAVAPKAPEF